MSLKQRTPTQVLSDEFCEILKTEHLQVTASVPRKNIYQQNNNELSEKRKNKDTRRTKT